MDSIFEKIKTITAEQLSIDLDKITLEANYTEDLGADSLDVVELVMAYEEAFDIEIPDAAAGGIETIGQAVDLCKSLVDGK